MPDYFIYGSASNLCSLHSSEFRWPHLNHPVSCGKYHQVTLRFSSNTCGRLIVFDLYPESTPITTFKSSWNVSQRNLLLGWSEFDQGVYIRECEPLLVRIFRVPQNNSQFHFLYQKFRRFWQTLGASSFQFCFSCSASVYFCITFSW